MDNINVQECAILLNKQQAIIIDVRETDEYDNQHIPESIHIPLALITLAKVQEVLQQHKNINTVIFQCQRGSRSAMAIEKIQTDNITFKAVNLEGGINAWVKEGQVFETNND